MKSVINANYQDLDKWFYPVIRQNTLTINVSIPLNGTDRGEGCPKHKENIPTQSFSDFKIGIVAGNCSSHKSHNPIKT